jgi:hypothetical protein
VSIEHFVFVSNQNPSELLYSSELFSISSKSFPTHSYSLPVTRKPSSIIKTEKMSNSTKTSRKGLQALVFGASGITGWAITNSALSYQTLSTFSRVVGLTRRPLSLEASGFPSDGRLQLYPGLDLSQDAETIRNI